MTSNNNAYANTKLIRAFFAIFPTKTVQSQLTDQTTFLHSLCGGRQITKQHIHLTLLFLGNVTTNRIAELCQIAKKISINSFDLNLEEIRYWKQSRIIHICAKQPPAELFMLVDALTDNLSAAGFIFDKRPYRPHVTLIRNAVRPVIITLNNSIRWPIDEWCLVQSLQTGRGVQYVVLNRWRLNQAS